MLCLLGLFWLRVSPFPCFDYLDSFDDLDSFEECWSGALWDISCWDLSGVFLMITLGWWVYRGEVPSHPISQNTSHQRDSSLDVDLDGLARQCLRVSPVQLPFPPFHTVLLGRQSLTQRTLKSLPAWGGRSTLWGFFIWISFTIYLFNISINSWVFISNFELQDNTSLRSVFRFCQFGHGSSFQWTICAVLWLCTWVYVCVHVSCTSFISDTTRGSPLTCVFPAPAPELAISPGALAPCPHRPMDPQCPVPPSPPGEGSGASVTLGSERLKPCLLHPPWAMGFSLWHVRSHDAGEAGRRGPWTSECPLLLEAKKEI